MPAQILDGKALAARLQTELMAEVSEFIENNATVPGLAVLLVGENPASEVYVRNKQKACERVGIDSRLVRLPGSATTDEVLAAVHKLDRDPTVHGILVQLPLPPAVSEQRVLHAVSPAKDVDGFHPDNVGRLVQGRPRFVPCTPLGVQRLLAEAGMETAGKHAVIVGRSEIVGKPMAMLLLARGAGGDATVTVCHSRSSDLASLTRSADILIAAVGQPRLIRGAMIRPGACVIDVGINRTEQGLVGDVDFDEALQVAGSITPVPGGVGPLTIAMLLENCLKAARAQVMT